MHKGVVSPSPEASIIGAWSLQTDRPGDPGQLAKTSLGLIFLVDEMKTGDGLLGPSRGNILM